MLDIVEKKFIKFIKTHHAGQTVKKKVPLNKKKTPPYSFSWLNKLGMVPELLLQEDRRPGSREKP